MRATCVLAMNVWQQTRHKPTEQPQNTHKVRVSPSERQSARRMRIILVLAAPRCRTAKNSDKRGDDGRRNPTALPCVRGMRMSALQLHGCARADGYDWV